MDDRLTARFNFMVTDAKNFLGDWDMCDPVVWAILRVVHAQNDLTYAIAADPSRGAERLTRYGEFGPGVKAEYCANAINPVALNCSWSSGGACACADAHSHLSGMTISRSLVSTTKMARSLAGSVLLALWLTW